MRPAVGSIGSCASLLPNLVSLRSESMAPNSSSRAKPDRIAAALGGSMKGNDSISPSREAIIFRITSARFDLWISGVENSDRFKKSVSEYSRMQIPS